MTIKISFTSRKTNILSPSSLHCFKRQITTINPTIGCVHQCAYCYARGYSLYPGDRNVVIYDNLVKKLVQELPRKRILPQTAFFSTSCDAFQPIPQILNISYKIMKILLNNGIAVTFLTKGYIPPNFLKLFESYPNLVYAKIGIITTNRNVQQVLEPYAPSPQKRLNNIQELISRGINTEVRMDPIIPGITDNSKDLNKYFKTMGGLNIKSVVLNYLLLRNLIKSNLKKAMSQKNLFEKTITHYESGKKVSLKAENSKAFALNTLTRKRNYQMIANIAASYNVNTYVCGCKNIDITNNMVCSKTVKR